MEIVRLCLHRLRELGLLVSGSAVIPLGSPLGWVTIDHGELKNPTFQIYNAVRPLETAMDGSNFSTVKSAY